MRRRDPYSWTVVRLPERDLAELVFELAAPLLEKLGPAPPPAEKRVAIGGKFLDEVRISQGGNTYTSFPVERHRGVVGDDGGATVYTMLPSALELFAEGRLTRVGGEPVEVVIGGRSLGPMVLTEVRCGGENYRQDIAVLVFRRAGVEGRV